MRKSEMNTEYKIVLTERAKTHFRKIIYYILDELKSAQAAANVTNDMENTVRRLSHTAGVRKLCDDPDLRIRGYRMIHFQRHRYFMLYRIKSDIVYVDGIYHDMQDYENLQK